MENQPKILVIDDEEAARYGICRALEGQGYLLEEASDGEAALAKIRKFQPEIIVSDINMPGIDGLALLEKVQEDPDAPLVVLITAYGSEEVVVQALRLGAYNYLSKPFEVAELRVIVRNALDKQRLLRENRHYVEELQRTLSELRQSQTALVQAEKMASLGGLVAGLAHEINTPLGVLQSSTQTIESAARKMHNWLQEQFPQQVGDAARFIDVLSGTANASQAACARIDTVVTNLREFTQLNRGEYRRASIHEGIESALNLANHAFGNDIEVVKDYGDLPEIECSPRELNQVFMNLLLNASDAIHQGGTAGAIRLRTRSREDFVEFEIEDNGSGIAAEHLEKIFDPGFTTKGVRVGVGLGLAICYQIVDAHRGRIEVNSRVGEGSSFTVTLPVNSRG